MKMIMMMMMMMMMMINAKLLINAAEFNRTGNKLRVVVRENRAKC